MLRKNFLPVLLFFAYCLIPKAETYAQTVPELMYYKFDVAGTTVSNDASSPVGTNPATITGLTIGGLGQFGMGLNGTAGATASYRLDPAWTGTHSGSWTISFWMNVPSPPTTRYMFGNSSGNGTFRCFIGGAANGIRLTGGTPNITLDMPNWTSGTNVITYVYDQTAGTVSGYINGVFQTSVTPGSSYPLVGTNFVVGSQGTSIDGIMDEFRMYNRALSQTEISSTWNSPLPLTACTTPPVAGTAIIGNSTGCAGQNVALSLTGNSMGLGQTYQWQSAPSSTGPWTNIGAANPGPTYSHVATAGVTYYQCVITCSASSVTTTNTISSNMTSGVSGTYTINSAVPTGSGNFQTFKDAISFLSCGVSGPVTFNVTPGSGPYNDTLYFNQLLGSSSTNSVRINGNGATVNFANTADARQMVRIVGSKHLRIDSLNFVSTNTTYAYGAVINGGAQYDSITNCTFNVGSTSSTTAANTSGICFSGSFTSPTTAGANATNCFINNNTIIGATGAGSCYYGITLTSGADSNIISNNLISNFYMYGIYQNGSKFNKILNNEINRVTKTSVTTFYGIYGTGDVSGTLVNGNKIHSPGGTVGGTSSTYGIYVLSDASVANPGIYSNNIFYNVNQGGIIYGAYLSSVSNIQLYHNTFVIDQTLTGTSANTGIHSLGTNTNLIVKNNLVSITAGTGGVKNGFNCTVLTAAPTEANGNIYYVNSTQSGSQYFGSVNAVTYATKADFDLASTGYEINSIVANPQFTNAAIGNLLPTNATLAGSGVPISSIVSSDIINLPRSVFATPGAYEIPQPVGPNGRALALITPEGAFCSSMQQVKISIMNLGTTSLSNFQIQWQLNGVAQTPVTYSGTLQVAGTGKYIDTIVLGNINIPSGTNSLKAWTMVNSDINVGNDTLFSNITPSVFSIAASNASVCVGNGTCINITPGSGYSAGITIGWQSAPSATGPWTTMATNCTGNLTANGYYRALILQNSIAICTTNVETVIVNDPQITATTPASRCGTGSVTLGATANAGSTIKWYDAATAGTQVGTGTSLLTPSISSNTTYYAEPTTGNTLSMPSPNIGTSTFITTTTGWGLRFTVNTEATIDSVTISALNSSAGTANIQIRITDLSDVLLYSGTAHSFTIGTSLANYRIPVNIAVPPGNYKMVMTYTGISSMVRESSGVSFPYTSSGNEVSITAGANGTGTAQTTSAYYWFYDWKITTGCTGPRVPVLATVNTAPTVALGNDTMVCAGTSLVLTMNNAGGSYLWSNNNTSNSITAGTPGTYWGEFTNAQGCKGSDTIVIFHEPNPVVNLGNDTFFCDGNSVPLTMSNTGGTYLWNNAATTQSINANTAGSYWAQFTTTSGCKGADTVNVTMAPNPVVNLGNDTSFCDGQNITLNMTNTGGDYLWSNAATTQSINTNTAGTYWGQFTNTQGCIGSDTIMVGVNALPIVALGNDTTICEGATLVLDAGNAGSSYLWNNATTAQTLNVNSAGSFDVIVTDANGCIGNDTIVVQLNDIPTATSITATNTSGMAFNFVVNAPANFTSVNWTFGDGGTGTGVNTSHTYATIGNYIVTCTLSNDCGDSTLTQSVFVTSGIQNVSLHNKIKLYPNPSTHSINIDAEGLSINEVIVVNSLGAVVKKQTVNKQATTQVDLSAFANGLYQIQVNTNKGRAITQVTLNR